MTTPKQLLEKQKNELRKKRKQAYQSRKRISQLEQQVSATTLPYISQTFQNAQQQQERISEKKFLEHGDLVNAVMDEAVRLKKKYQEQHALSPEQKQRLLQITTFMDQQQQNLRTPSTTRWARIRERAMHAFRSQDLPIKFSSDYYHFLKKMMWQYRCAGTIINRYHTSSQKGLAFEAMWTILISLHFCDRFQEYDFYEATLKTPTEATPVYFIRRIITNSEYMQFLRQTPIKGPNGKSDITLRNRHTGEWIFISCKYYKKEHDDYDVRAIYRAIQETNHRHPNLIGDNYKIYIFANDRDAATNLITNSRIDPNIKNKVKTNNTYNILGMDDLQSCFASFKDKSGDMSWEDFTDTYIKRYIHLPSFGLRLDQVPLVNKTFAILYEKLSHNKCGTRGSSPKHPNLRFFWKTFPQFGKTFCVGQLLVRYNQDIPKLFKEGDFFNTVIIVDRQETVEKYANEVLGGHGQFVRNNFNVIIVENNRNHQQMPLSQYLRRGPDQKVLHTLEKYKKKNNILIVPNKKNDIDLVKDLPGLRFVVFDEYNDQSILSFESFKNSQNKIGLFLTNHRIPPPSQSQTGCSFTLEWTLNDTKAIQQVHRQLSQDPHKQIGELLSAKRMIQKHKQTFGRSLSVPLLNSTEDGLKTCLKNSLDLYMVSEFLSPDDSIGIRYTDETAYQKISDKRRSKTPEQIKQTSVQTHIISQPHLQAQQKFIPSRTKSQQHIETDDHDTKQTPITTRTQSKDEPLLDKIKRVLHIINKKHKNKLSFSTQLFFTNDFNTSQRLRDSMKNDAYFNVFDIVIYNEDKAHPGPIQGKLSRLINHYQEIGQTHQKKGLIFLLNATSDVKGVSLPNVYTVFALNDEKAKEETTLLSYLMIGKCLTPRRGKKSVFFVDFNRDRLLDLIQNYFDKNITTVASATKLVDLVDMNYPYLTSPQVAQLVDAKKPRKHPKVQSRAILTRNINSLARSRSDGGGASITTVSSSKSDISSMSNEQLKYHAKYKKRTDFTNKTNLLRLLRSHGHKQEEINKLSNTELIGICDENDYLKKPYKK